MYRLCLLLLVICIVGCGPRAEVAKKKLLAKIDSLLGKMDVKRETIRESVSALKDGINGIRKAKIKAQVKSDQIGRQIAPLDQKITAIDTTLKKLRDHLKGNVAVEIAGNTYTPAELKGMADKVIQARADLVKQKDGYPHGHVPSPLQIADHVGDTPRSQLLREVMTLTKMNWNSANMAGLLPITLRFSRLVGDILREVPESQAAQPKYKYYM